MKKLAAVFIGLLLLIPLFSGTIYASAGFVPPTSRFYFLQVWGEDAKLFLTTNPQQKFNYLLALTDRRVSEIALDPSTEIINRYQDQVSLLIDLSDRLGNKQIAVQSITEANLRQQTNLAKVYLQVPAQAKGAILGAQTASQKHVENTIRAVEGDKKAEDFNKQVAVILKAEQQGKIEQIEMESGPNPNPSEDNINSIRGANPINSLNKTGGSPPEGGMQPAAPIQQR